MSLGLKKNDTVVVLAGKDKGRKGRVLNVERDDAMVTVEKVNVIKRHTKPNRTNQQGGIIEKEAPIHISNVMLYDPKAKRGTRVRIQTRADGTRERISAASGETLPKGE